MRYWVHMHKAIAALEAAQAELLETSHALSEEAEESDILSETSEDTLSRDLHVWYDALQETKDKVRKQVEVAYYG